MSDCYERKQNSTHRVLDVAEELARGELGEVLEGRRLRDQFTAVGQL